MFIEITTHHSSDANEALGIPHHTYPYMAVLHYDNDCIGIVRDIIAAKTLEEAVSALKARNPIADDIEIRIPVDKPIDQYISASASLFPANRFPTDEDVLLFAHSRHYVASQKRSHVAPDKGWRSWNWLLSFYRRAT